jgi:hypothetical protein
VLCAEGSEAFQSLPAPIRNLGPWTGGPAGELERLRLPYRVLLGEQGFVLVYCHVSQLQLEAANARSLRAANTECLSLKFEQLRSTKGLLPTLLVRPCPQCRKG